MQNIFRKENENLFYYLHKITGNQLFYYQLKPKIEYFDKNSNVRENGVFQRTDENDVGHY
jgi:hypothetical protein